jgi:hypothetical protein
VTSGWSMLPDRARLQWPQLDPIVCEHVPPDRRSSVRSSQPLGQPRGRAAVALTTPSERSLWRGLQRPTRRSDDQSVRTDAPQVGQ